MLKRGGRDLVCGRVPLPEGVCEDGAWETPCKPLREREEPVTLVREDVTEDATRLALTTRDRMNVECGVMWRTVAHALPRDIDAQRGRHEQQDAYREPQITLDVSEHAQKLGKARKLRHVLVVADDLMLMKQ